MSKKTKTKKNRISRNRKWEIIFASILVSIAFLLILVYYIIFPFVKPNLPVPCDVNIIITVLLSFGTAFGIKLVDKR